MIGLWASVTVLLFLASLAPCADPASTSASVVPIERDVVYGRSGETDLKLDFARPLPGEGPFPLVVCFHGGGWQQGNKESHHKTLQYLAARGYAAAAVEYRLTPKFKWPAQINDAKCAIRYLRAHARELKIDPAKVAALGDSA
ncbi:alpha/beta hydrolase, partial [Candidatus Sumerlaeota bacterium]|nr:alpha/beta hydrolase [Candidatus Sumerlaeota bacterium]